LLVIFIINLLGCYAVLIAITNRQDVTSVQTWLFMAPTFRKVCFWKWWHRTKISYGDYVCPLVRNQSVGSQTVLYWRIRATSCPRNLQIFGHGTM